LGITVHAGEPLIPGISKNILTAIDHMGADRIGHGLQAIEDPTLIEQLAQSGIPLELCPTSNWLTGATPSFQAHPFKRLHAAGVRVTINTDDPGIMCTNLLHEYHMLATHQGIPLSVFEQCNAWAFESSFIAADKKKAVWHSPS
jgi:adenosine deaminase